jgi:hypothetical protein
MDNLNSRSEKLRKVLRNCSGSGALEESVDHENELRNTSESTEVLILLMADESNWTPHDSNALHVVVVRMFF